MKLKTIAWFFLGSLWTSHLYGFKDVKVDESQPVLYYADSQTYDRELGILILKGHVEFDHQGTILEADYVTYNENTDIVTASGNVRLRQPNGEVNFAEYVELTGDMKEGIALQLRSLLEDNSKLAALEARKFEDREELDQAVYTPCQLCGDKPPTWQINARRAVKDNVGKDIHFTDSEFRVFDVPLFYMPYATQPLERRSGFLIPQPGITSDFGFVAEVPYYFALSEDKDMTLTPVIFTQQDPLLLGQYRQAFKKGDIQLDGSIAKYRQSGKDKKAAKNNKYEIPNIRGHAVGYGKFDLNDTWRFKVIGGYVSDKTYFRKYKYGGWQNDPALTSKAILDGFLNPRDYAAAKMYYFQGLRDKNVQRNIAQALPLIEYSGYSGVDPIGGRFKFDANILNIYREHGINYQRGIGEVGWQRPWMVPFGQVFTAFGSVRGDLYQVEDFRKHPSKKKLGGSRFFPQAGLDWRWPFVNTWQHQSFIVQPAAEIVIAPNKPYGASFSQIPNVDSVDFEFNDANLFSPDRFPGYDRIDTGSRFVYGGEILSTGKWFGDVDIFFGQSYSLSKPILASDEIGAKQEAKQGIGHRFSDYVGRVEASPWSWLTLTYRFRLDRETFNWRVSEIGGGIGPAIARLSGDYVFISRHAGTPNNRDFNQISLNFSSAFVKNWTFVAGIIQNLNKQKDNGGTLQKNIGLLYADDCFGLGITVKRQYYKARDVRPATIVMFNLTLKNIGTYNYSLNLNNNIFGMNPSQVSANP
ncbi:MAG: LPS assembly protein LptD [Alphaproteobacteria bacterium]|nr:LPS assembly protein LptD [Alphaproteobacteria bacterium]